MKVYYNKFGKVDFQAPVYMDEDYFNKFCKFLSELLKEKVDVIQTKEKERWVGETEKHPKKWTTKELLLLLSPMNNDELGSQLKRSDMSILMKRGEFVPAFMSWAKKKGYKTADITVTVINKFLEEQK